MVWQDGLNMPLRHWQLVILTAGVDSSLLSIGSAAGVALMGKAQGQYTFSGHLRMAPAILLGYAAGLLIHLWMISATF
jgi:Na+/H+ antiporter NhaD/arsenite permease-like protein